MSTPPFTYSRVTLAGPLWTVAEAKQLILRITDAAEDADVQEKLDAAQEAILAFLGGAADPTWTPATAPRNVKHAILLMTSHYYEHRGDELTRDTPDIWNQIRNALGQYRDVGLA